jgi:general secretion pathway protein G
MPRKLLPLLFNALMAALVAALAAWWALRIFTPAPAAPPDIASIMQALKLYRLDNSRYPTTEQGLQALITKPGTEPLPGNWKAGGYLERSSVPKDPWGHPYQYLSPGTKGEIDVFSLGADQQPGGEGPDADIGSWQL